MLARKRKLPQNVHLARAPHAKTYKHHIKRIAKISPNTTAANKTHKTSCTHKLSESSIGKLRSSVLIASLGGQRAAQKASARRPRATRCCSTPWGMFARRLFVCLRLYTRARSYIFARSCLYLLVRFSSPEAVTHSRPPFGLLAFPVNYLCCGLFTQLDLGPNSLAPTLKKRSKTGNGTHADCEGIQAKAST